jgi:NADPH:quinone reductase
MTIDTKQMDAVVIEAGGPPAQSLAYRREPVPEPGPGEVLVEVHAAAVNPLDVVNAAGWLGTPLPVTPGGDYAGTVVSDGDQAGQQVWGSGPALGMAMGTKRQGTHARFVALPETWLSRKPEQLTMAEAAAVGRSYFVAWQTVINIMQLMPGETILITGGAGMVGQAAAAIARWRGAEPIIAGRTHKPNGAGHFIDTTSTDMREAVLELTGGQGADLALDTVGGALFQPALRSLRFGGRLTGIFSAPEPQADFSVAEIYNRQLHVTGLASVFMDGADVARIFDQLRPLFDRGYLAPPPVQTWPLKDSAGAYQTVLDGSAGIKQVLLPTLLSPADSAGQGVAQQRLPGRPAAVDPDCLAAPPPRRGRPADDGRGRRGPMQRGLRGGHAGPGELPERVPAAGVGYPGRDGRAGDPEAPPGIVLPGLPGAPAAGRAGAGLGRRDQLPAGRLDPAGGEACRLPRRGGPIQVAGQRDGRRAG